MKSVINCIEPLSFPFKTPDPFLFCVYHKDHYPAGNLKMEAPRKGNGADFDPSASYRMYHGDKIPGFPQHPHRGFETLTATINGLVDHCDSLGNAGRYGQGDLQWMTAGKGIVHGEMFPLININAPNPTRFFQIWMNLPARSKMVEPDFVMHWNEDIPKFKSPDGGAKITLWNGQLQGHTGLTPPINSYASHPDSETAVILIELSPGASYTIPAAKRGNKVNRMVYYIEGKNLNINTENIPNHSSITLKAEMDTIFTNNHSTQQTDLLILQGVPINEPIAQHGPFVMNTQEEIQQAFQDYRKNQFGGWPWPDDAMVFPREKGRFALVNGIESQPPAISSNSNSSSSNEL